MSWPATGGQEPRISQRYNASTSGPINDMTRIHHQPSLIGYPLPVKGIMVGNDYHAVRFTEILVRQFYARNIYPFVRQIVNMRVVEG